MTLMRSIISIITPIRRKRLWALLAALLLAVPWTAQAEMMTDVGVHLGIISVATTQINPLTPVEREFMSLTSLIYEGLMYLDDKYQPSPAWPSAPAVAPTAKPGFSISGTASASMTARGLQPMTWRLRPMRSCAWPPTARDGISR